MSDNFSANAELSFDTNDFIASANAASKALERIEQQSEETASALDSTQNSENALNAAFKQSQTVVGGLAKQYDALVSFTYNVGTAAFRKSTLLKVLNRGDYKGAAAQIRRSDLCAVQLAHAADHRAAFCR